MNAPVRKSKCATCPFSLNPGALREVQDILLKRALALGGGEEPACPICHSTGDSDLYDGPRKPERLCRGARDVQLQWFAAIGFLEAPTDAAWAKKRKEMGLE